MAHSYSDLLVVLRDDARRRGDELVDAMRPALASIPGIRSSFTTPLGMRIDEGLAGTPADLSVKVFGPDLDPLESLSARVQEILSVNAPPGYSEHHTGQAIDITTPGYEPVEEVFETSPAFAWLSREAGRFGFSMPYTRENPYGIVYEPWHWSIPRLPSLRTAAGCRLPRAVRR